jgi:hypothetical protein
MPPAGGEAMGLGSAAAVPRTRDEFPYLAIFAGRSRVAPDLNSWQCIRGVFSRCCPSGLAGRVLGRKGPLEVGDPWRGSAGDPAPVSALMRFRRRSVPEMQSGVFHLSSSGKSPCIPIVKTTPPAEPHESEMHLSAFSVCSRDSVVTAHLLFLAVARRGREIRQSALI